MKIQNKIIYLVIIIFVLYTLLYSGFIYYSISNYAFTDFYKRLEIRAATTAKIKLERPSDVSHILEMEQEYLDKLPNQTEYILPIIDGQIQKDSLSQVLPKPLLEEVLEHTYGSYSEGIIFYSGITYESQDGNKFMVVVSAENYFYSHHIAYLRTLLLTSLAFGILWIVFFSFIVSRTLIRPIKNIINDVRNISSENLHLRLNVPKQNDSLSRLAFTFNDMLNRLETSFETQKNFISNASHELNTPLTSIIGEADFALSKERDADAYKVALGKILEEAEKLDKKTKALLFLAQTGFNGKAQKFDKIRIDQLILDVQDTVQKINSGFKFKLDFSLLPENPEKLKVKGNEQLLHLALSNIMVNACKYSNNEVVHIAFGATDKDAFIVVRDAGIGIPENELQYIYDPYFRASNTGSHEGYGIGLPLSRNIIKMHNGTLQVNSKLNVGTTVMIHIPIGNYTL